MIDLNDLRLFARVVDHGGFAAASRASGIPRSTLSKRVAALERSLDVRLIQRTSRRFAVTEIGSDLHRHAAAMVIEADAAEAVVRSRQAEPAGTVRITASIPAAQTTLAPLLPEIADAYPRVTIVLHATDRFVDLVQENFDIGLRAHFAPLPDSSLVQRVLRVDPGILVAAPAYVDRRGAPPTIAALAQHDGLLPAPSTAAWTIRDADGGSATIAPLPRFFADDWTTLLAAARHGLGIACLPSALCAADLRSGALVRVREDWSTDGVTTTMLVPHRRGRLPAVTVVADHVVRRMAAGGEAG